MNTATTTRRTPKVPGSLRTHLMQLFTSSSFHFFNRSRTSSLFNRPLSIAHCSLFTLHCPCDLSHIGPEFPPFTVCNRMNAINLTVFFASVCAPTFQGNIIDAYLLISASTPTLNPAAPWAAAIIASVPILEFSSMW